MICHRLWLGSASNYRIINIFIFKDLVFTQSLWKFCSKKSTAVFFPHAKFFTRRECSRFHGKPVEILFQKINCGFFATRKVFSQKRVPKIPWRACGNFDPKSQVRFFRHTQSFSPEESAQDSMESLWKFCSKKSTATFSPHPKFSARRKCSRFHGEPAEILFQKINCGFFVARKVFRLKRVPKIPWRACWNPRMVVCLF